MPFTDHLQRHDDTLASISSQLSELTSKMSAANKSAQHTRVWDVIAKLTVAAVLAGFGFVGALRIDIGQLDKRVTYIEATRFTNNDFLARMAELDRRISTAAQGPEWLRNELVSLRVVLDAQKENLAKMSERIARMESELKK